MGTLKVGIVGAGVMGVGMIAVPDTIVSTLGWPAQDPITLGILGSLYIASGLLSVLGLRSPLRFSPVLLLQLFYKVLWLITVALPLALTGQIPCYATCLAAIFATYVVGDLIAIPWAYVLEKEPRS